MLTAAAIRQRFRDMGPANFIRQFEADLGLRYPKGHAKEFQRCSRRFGSKDRPVLESHEDAYGRRSGTLSPESVDIKALAFGLLGEGAADLGNCVQQACRGPRTQVLTHVLESELNKGIDTSKSLSGWESIFESTGTVLEAEGTELVPSQFPHTTTFNTAALGLLEAKVIESFNRPGFLADTMMETDSTLRRSELWGGTSLPGDESEIRHPGQTHRRMQLTERYVTTRNTENYNLAVDVTYEAQLFDHFKTIMAAADKLGEALALNKEYRMWQVILGSVNPYTYDGTNYNTYLTSGNWINKIAGNPLTDYSALNAAFLLFTNMTDQETNQPISVNPSDIFVMPGGYATALNVLQAAGIYRFTSADPAANTFPGIATGSKSPTDSFFRPNLIGGPTYPYAQRIAMNASSGIADNRKGLNLNYTQASQYWLTGEFKRAFKYVENYPLFTQRLTNSGSYEMTDRRLVLSIFADEMGTPEVAEPRFVVINTN